MGAGETVYPDRLDPLAGALLSVSAGVHWKHPGVGARFATGVYTGGTKTNALMGEFRWRAALNPAWRFTFRIGAGYAWIHDVNLTELDLGTYDSSGFAFTAGPMISWLPSPPVAIGLGMRLDGFFFSRPALGPCDDAHGCNGIFYPDERATGGIDFIEAEAGVTYDF